MKLSHQAIATLIGAGLLISATPNLASASPDLRLTWIRMRNANFNDCLREAVDAMRDQGLTNIEVKDNEFVQGETRNSEAKIMCIDHRGEIIAAIAVSSDRSGEARDIRDGLRNRMRN